MRTIRKSNLISAAIVAAVACVGGGGGGVRGFPAWGLGTGGGSGCRKLDLGDPPPDAGLDVPRGVPGGLALMPPPQTLP